MANKLNESVPRMVADIFEERIHDLLSDTLKNILPRLIKDSEIQCSQRDGKLKACVSSKGDEQGYSHKSWQLVDLIRELVRLIEPVPASAKAATEWENVSTQAQSDHVKDNNPAEDIPSPAQGEQVATVIFNNISYDQFTANLFSSRSSEYSLTPPPPKVVDKGKVIAFEDDQIKQIMPLMDQGGSTLSLSILNQFRAAREGQMTIEEAKAQMKEIKRLAELKAEKEKFEKRLKKVMTPDELRAQAEGLARYEAKRAKKLEEYNHCISFRADPSPITKISYQINNSTKEASMRIIRNNQPLNLTVYDRFVLKMLGFSEWLELHDLASRVVIQAGKLGISPLHQLSAFGLSTSDKKRKKSFEILKEVFVKEDIVVDGMHRNLVPRLGVVASGGLAIREPASVIFFYNGNFDMIFQREEEYHLATNHQLIRIQNVIKKNSVAAKGMFNKLNFVIEARNDVVEARKIVLDNLGLAGCKASTSNEGLPECKASASNLRRIQVRDIVKEVEDYLKTYSSAEMDIN
ncbi:hypothetical protein Tco_1271671 [Tanacetum coccineum]